MLVCLFYLYTTSLVVLVIMITLRYYCVWYCIFCCYYMAGYIIHRQQNPTHHTHSVVTLMIVYVIQIHALVGIDRIHVPHCLVQRVHELQLPASSLERPEADDFWTVGCVASPRTLRKEPISGRSQLLYVCSKRQNVCLRFPFQMKIHSIFNNLTNTQI